MKHLFIINPVAGGKDKTEELRVLINKTMQKTAPQDEYDIYVTKAPMDAARVVRERASQGGKLRIYACGGDGTLSECADGAAGFPNVAITHFPIGTGNDFIKMFGADAVKFKDLSLLVNGEETEIDLINCNGRRGLNICSVGIDARIGTDVHKYSGTPVLGGRGGYIISTLVNIIKGINQNFAISFDNERLEGEFSLVCACNGRYYGGFFNPVPEAQPDDGLIEFLIIKKVSRLGFLQMVKKYQSGRYKELSSITRRVSTVKMTIESEEEMAINIDGELERAKKAEFVLEPGNLRVFYPRGIHW